jgi:hypothetical protein
MFLYLGASELNFVDCQIYFARVIVAITAVIMAVV